MQRRLRMEELEERIAPTVIAAGNSLTWADANGDSVTIEYDGPDGSQVDVLDTLGGDIDGGDDIGTITFTGASLLSELIITCDGAGGDDIVIDGGISAPGAQDVGTIDVGMGDDGVEMGEAVLGTGFSLDVGGAIGTAILNGDFDCDTMNQSVTAGGDIGVLVVMGNVHLESGTGLLNVAAGGVGGAGDISFVYLADQPYIGSGTGTPMDPEMFTTTSGAIADDAGNGTIGTIKLTLSGPAPAGAYWAVPVVGGGNVLGHVAVGSPNAKLTISTSGGGGDVSGVSFDTDAVGLYITGAADTDVFEVIGDGNIVTVSNRTVGGDIGIVDSLGDVGTIQTGKLGNLGGIYTGAGNSMPVFDLYDFVDTDGTIVDGHIGKINVGAISEGDIEAASIGTITAKYINWTSINVLGGISLIKVNGIHEASIFAGGALGNISVGSQGVSASMIQGLGGIDSLSVKGIIVNSTISSQYQDMFGSQLGGTIGSVKADAIFGTDINAVGGVDKISVKGAFMESDIDTRWLDTNLAQYVGAGIGSVSAGGMYDVDVDCFLDVGTLKVGAGGMRESSTWNILGNVGSVRVSGDIDGAEIDLDGTLGTVKVSGSMMGDTYIYADVINSVQISGSIADAFITAGCSAGKISVKGDIYGDYDSIGSPAIYVGGDVISIAVGGGIHLPTEAIAIEVGGTIGSLSVKGALYSADLVLDNVGKLSLGGVTYYCDISIEGNVQQLGTQAIVDTDIAIGEDLTTAKINGDLLYTDIAVYGSVGTLSIGGDVMDADIALEGATLGTLSIKGDVMSSNINTGDWGVSATTAGTISLGGSVIETDMDIYGPLANLSVKGQAFNMGIGASDALTKIAFSRSITGTSIFTTGAVTSMSVGGSAYESSLRADSGIGSVVVKGNLVNSDVLARAYDGFGDPLAVDIGSVSAAAVYDSDILATGDISSVNVKGVMQRSNVSAVGYDGYGSGSAVSGGSISSLKAAGLVNSNVEAYTDIQAIQLGAYGVDYKAGISTVTGDLAGLTTKGLIYGGIRVGGDLTGNILSAGNDALLYEDVYYFTDSNGGLIEGTMTVDGIVAPGVIVS